MKDRTEIVAPLESNRSTFAGLVKNSAHRIRSFDLNVRRIDEFHCSLFVQCTLSSDAEDFGFRGFIVRCDILSISGLRLAQNAAFGGEWRHKYRNR